MRKNQLSFTLETFGDQTPDEKRNYKMHGYIDANNLEEVVKEELKCLHKTFRSNISFEEFVNKIQNFEEPRFGRTEISTSESEDFYKKT